MARTLKSKLTLGLSFLFVIILLLSGVGAYFLYHLSRSTEATLQDNYRSVAYARSMADALADMRQARTASTGQFPAPAYKQASQAFQRHLTAEQGNITEPGERELVDSLTTAFRQYAGLPTEQAPLYQQVHTLVGRVATLNLHAIEHQATSARQAANRTIATLGLLAAMGLLATFSFIFSVPDYLTRPVEELTTGIRRVAEGHFDQRLPVRHGDEFAPVAVAFNDLAHRLDSYETADGTPRLDDSGPLERVTTHHRPGSPTATAPTDAAQRQLVEQLRQQARQLQRTADALLNG